MPEEQEQFYVQFDKQGPIEAKLAQEAQEMAAEELIASVEEISDKPNPVESLMQLGFSINVSTRRG